MPIKPSTRRQEEFALCPKDSDSRRYSMNARPIQLPRATPWRSLPCPRTELRLDLVLCGGQTFRWSETSPGYWTGVLAGRVWTLTQSEEHLWYTLHEEEKEDGGRDEEDGLTPSQILQDYFQLHINVSALYQGWSYVDSHFREVGVKFPGRQT
uniref:8-oxoguanine DNA glycosylase N-terminal domain-containing protein n=1 Tax=Laticauda laticaudata TaxID=8630 RepID=A0A8C5WRI6_LATLA